MSKIQEEDFRLVPIRSKFPVYWVLLFLMVIAMPLGVDAREEKSVRIHIQGVEGKQLENVKAALVLPDGLVQDGSVNVKWMEHFEKQIPRKVEKALEPFGYYDPEVFVNPGERNVDRYEIYVDIDPGQAVLVTEINISVQGPGNDEKEIRNAAAAFPLHRGDQLNHDKYGSGKDAIRDEAVALGYLDADFSKHELRVNPEELWASVNLVLETGERYHFGDIQFTGAPDYPRPFLGRFLEFKPGDVYSHQKIGETQKNFRSADRFRSVTVNADNSNAIDHTVPVVIDLQASKPKRLRMGVGYQTDIGIKGTFKYEDVNVFDTSHKFDSQLDFSQPLQVIGGRYTVPDPQDFKSFTSLSLTAKKEDYRNVPDYLFANAIPNFYSDTITAEIERARALGKHGTGSIFLQLLKERSNTGEEGTDTFSIMPGFRLAAMQYDNEVRPQRGRRYRFEIKGAHPALGSSTGFIQVIGDGGIIIPLPARFAVLVRTQLGATLQNEERENMPIALRFWAGGDKSVRGYKYRSLGPTDDEGNVIGGKNLFVGSVELEKAIGKDYGVAAFYDTGNAFDDFGSVNLAQAAGMGFRYYSPVGPIKLDIAHQIAQPRPDFRIHITIGFGL
ncbi:MAG: autotransporter assembly complex protein TamA [Syntrophorhabdaceae bacterium]